MKNTGFNQRSLFLFWVCFIFWSGPAGANSAKNAYVEAYRSGNSGDWYRGENNETALLAWGEAYVMMSLASMYRATMDPTWLDTLSRHADDALMQRDDKRGVKDYRDVSTACWRNRSYQPEEQPYCYVVHSGMIAYPMAEWARLVNRDGLQDEVAYDGRTFGDKADTYLRAAKETVAAHEDQWRAEGYYVFRPDASFMTYAGRDIPLNQSNTMGRLLVTLYAVTGDKTYYEKAKALADRFKAQLTNYRWNYWGGPYAGVGEDVSHAAINVDFAALCMQNGITFTDVDMRGFGKTFVDSVYLDDQTFSDFVGGGTANGSGYLPQVGRWLRITPWKTAVYTAVRDLYTTKYLPKNASASMALSWAHLAEFEPERCAHFFYSVDWADPDPDTVGDMRTATAYGANVLTTPSDMAVGCMIPLEVEMDQRVTTGQWDGSQYHRVATWTAGTRGLRHVPYEPQWDFVYWRDGVLFQFADPEYSGAGVRVRESLGLGVPLFTSTPPTEATIDGLLEYPATADGDGPYWWSLATFPTGARVSANTGVVTWTPTEVGEVSFTLRVENDAGIATQVFTVQVDTADTGDPDTGSPDTGDTDTDTGPPDTGDEVEDSGAPEREATGCACQHGSRAMGLWSLVIGSLAVIRRRRPLEASHKTVLM